MSPPRPLPPQPANPKVPKTSEEVDKRAEVVAKKVKDEVDKLRKKADPAVMQVDLELLTDIVTLAITAAVFGLVAVNCFLPSTAGFLLGGMFIGPSYLALIRNIKEVQTLSQVRREAEERSKGWGCRSDSKSNVPPTRITNNPSLSPIVSIRLLQFGSVFLLFEQGLMYSIEYSRREEIEEEEDGDDEVGGGAREDGEEGGGEEGISFMRSPPPQERRNSGGDRRYKNDAPAILRPLVVVLGRDLRVAGVVLFAITMLCTCGFLLFLDCTSGPTELFVVGSAVTLTSSTVISESLHAAHLKESKPGRKILKIVAVQDLIMVPLLAFPEIMHSLKHEGHEVETYKELFMRGLFVWVFFKLR